MQKIMLWEAIHTSTKEKKKIEKEKKKLNINKLV